MQKGGNVFALFLALGMLIFMASCNSHDTNSSGIEFAPSDTDTSESDIREMKPKFLDFPHTNCHLANGEANRILVVRNSTLAQRAWMVYYDHKNRSWDTIVWTGTGTDNKVIADTVFNRVYGISDHPGPIDDPTFYMAYSKDTGRTWEKHTVEKAILDCDGSRSQLLVSDDIKENKGRPSLVIILRSARNMTPTSSRSMEQWDNKYLCPLSVSGKKDPIM